MKEWRQKREQVKGKGRRRRGGKEQNGIRGMEEEAEMWDKRGREEGDRIERGKGRGAILHACMVRGKGEGARGGL